MFDFVRRGRRSVRVMRAGAMIYLGYKRTQRDVRNLPQEQRDAAWERRHAEFAERLYQLAIDLKGLYVKTGQFVGTRSDTFPEAYTRSLSRLQDRVPPRNLSVIHKTIEADFGQPVSELFACFDPVPLAAASLAQVHRATLHNGREVAVKVQYPEVASLVRLDVRNLRTMAGLVARREKNFDYRSIVDEISRQVPLELDFVREAGMTRRIAVNMSGVDGLVVPGVIDELVRPRVLVTEFIPGSKLIDGGAFAGTAADGARIAQTLAAAFGRQVLIDGLFQADPHPGNLLLTPEGAVALLDFGLTKELSDSGRLNFARLVVAAANRDLPGLLSAFDALGLKTRGKEPTEMFALMDLFFGSREGFARGAQRARTRETLSRSPIEALPSDLILFGRVVGLLRGVCASLGAPLTPMQMLRPYAEQALLAVATS
jgi:aarF domain-containing kinase